MGIFSRLEDVIKSYLNQEDERLFGRSGRGDPDLEEAEAELESFLRDGGTWSDARSDQGTGSRTRNRDWSDPRGKTRDWGDTGGRTTGGAWSDAGSRTGDKGSGNRGAGPSGRPPEELRQDFAELGLPFGAGAEECKAAYRRLLKLHHPDRHAGHQGNMEKATKKMAKINAAYERIENWRANFFKKM
ncbi:MAG: J domain-containing protein [Treponema sp.]|nr:J domain-containing protein [Treponema sp.]